MRRREIRTEERIRSYHAVEFEDLGDAVDFCQKIVPHVVPPVGCVEGAWEAQAVVWFHVPCDGSAKPGCCRLYLSHPALVAAKRAGLQPYVVESISRTALPYGAVLVFGEDDRDPTEMQHHAAGAARPAGAGRMSARQVEALDTDSVLR